MGTALCALAPGYVEDLQAFPVSRKRKSLQKAGQRRTTDVNHVSKPLCGPLKTHNSPPGGQVINHWQVESLATTSLCGEEQLQSYLVSVELDSVQRFQPVFALPVCDLCQQKNVRRVGEVGGATVSHGSCSVHTRQ